VVLPWPDAAAVIKMVGQAKPTGADRSIWENMDTDNVFALTIFPDGAWTKQPHARVQLLCWPVSGLVKQISSPSQARIKSAQWL
jgi:hypothetical protein